MPAETPDSDHVATLLVSGPDVSTGVLEILRIQLELFLEELDRENSPNPTARFT